MEPQSIEDIPKPIALGLALLLVEPQTWIHRRVEQVAYLDRTTVHRRISIDFETSEQFQEESGTGIAYLPVAQFAKEKLVNFDMRAADGTPIPMLTAEQNGILSSALLLAMARLNGSDQIDSVVERYIPRLVNSRNTKERELSWHRIFEPGTSVGAHLKARPVFVALADNLSRNFILYIPTRHLIVGRRQIVKLAFDAPRSAVAVRGLRSRLGWREVQDRFRVPYAGYCGSYHFELQAPSEMQITSGRFVATRNGEPVVDSIPSPTQRGHLNLSRLDQSDAFVVVSLRARSRELLGGVTLFSMLNALTLLFVRLRLPSFRIEGGTDAVVAALLALPGILTSYVARPSEHELVSSFLTDLRRIAMTSVVTSFFAALVLFGGFSEATLGIIFDVLVAIGALAALTLLRSWLAQRSEGFPRRTRMLD